VMRAGEIVEVGPTEQVYTDPQHPYTRQLLASVPRLGQALAGRSAAELAAQTRAALVAEGATDEESAQRLAEEGARADAEVEPGVQPEPGARGDGQPEPGARHTAEADAPEHPGDPTQEE